MRINDIEFNCDLSQVLDELVVQLRANNIQLIQKRNEKGSTHIQICCPYHNGGMERRPSAGIRRSDGMFHCFACGEVHSLQEVISHCFGHDNDILGKWGWSWLLKNFATIQVEERKDVEIDLERSNISRKDNILDNGDIAKSNWVSEEELDSYRYYHPYWKKRGITDDNLIELFDLGYDARSQCITFPVRDISGHTLFVARRSVHTKYFNYPQGAEKPLYGLYELNCCGEFAANHNLPIEWTARTIIICESMIDALTCWQYGKYAVALNGLGNDLQFKQLRQLPCRKLILATDNDEAGQRARGRIRRNVKNKIITEYILPEGKKDINELSKAEFENLEEVF